MKTMSNKRQMKMNSVLGPLYLVATEQGLSGIYFEKQRVPMLAIKEKLKSIDHLVNAEKQLKEYFSGKRKSFQLALDIEGTVFQRKVWSQLMKIPFGKTQSYSDIAKGINLKKAMRAVGNANGKNPVCIIIPCHRVIAADGSIGGYSGGLDKKRKLLGVEGIELADI